jgi:hypothetical protein
MVEFKDGWGILPYRKLLKPSMRLEIFQHVLKMSFSNQSVRSGALVNNDFQAMENAATD